MVNVLCFRHNLEELLCLTQNPIPMAYSVSAVGDRCFICCKSIFWFWKRLVGKGDSVITDLFGKKDV